MPGCLWVRVSPYFPNPPADCASCAATIAEAISRPRVYLVCKPCNRGYCSIPPLPTPADWTDGTQVPSKEDL